MAKLIPRQYAKILYALTYDAKKEDLERILKEYIQFLRKEQVLSKVQYILKEFETYAKEKEGITQITLKSKNKLSKNVIKDILTKFEGKVEVAEELDASLNGGVVVKAGNTILDTSINTQLEMLKRSLI